MIRDKNSIEAEAVSNHLDNLLKLKKLLDAVALTQAEYDEKKLVLMNKI